ncbi:ERF family protein [Xenorhabdus bovienii]|uniref:Single-stranded DNA-binding protein n=1 Tax=Xenorhabdus bovienii str. Intermedium TaxID=1379677 RepID=A0A077QJ83_XENBV|nr:ERF family protein [Xenorhabdus bovienii]MDE9467533.1 ERF family protein [Xenorhabdus bovienii]MDE9548902.1 ERF family protein [Xenorhabdus bovienii]CDH33263.1 conserved hypothetical protein [Xenorhabdus bovienii str. Intermedium]
MSAVYKAISNVAKELAETGIKKNSENKHQKFMFRGIDAVYNALAPALVRHGLLILPRITERSVVERKSSTGGALFYVTVKAEFDFVATEDGSTHTVTTFGEAMDSGDKATNKAMSIAYKYAAFQAFCIPTEETAIDADAEAHQVAPKSADAVLRDFTEYATNEVNKEKLQQEYVNTWTALNGHPELQERCKEVTGIRIKELKREAA